MHKSFVLITGATGGLGRAFAVECASRGWSLFLTDVQAGALEALSTGLHNAYRVEVKTQVCDLTDIDSRKSLFNCFRQNNNRFWALINVAGVDFEGPFYEQSGQHIHTILRLNIEGSLAMIHALLPYRDTETTLRIVNVASLAAFFPMPRKATYAASKRFLLDFSVALNEEARELGITVTVLCPAGMPTTQENLDAIEAQGIMGLLTTKNVGEVASRTLDCALEGHLVYIPGILNQLLTILGSYAPLSFVLSLISNRWKSAQLKQPVQ